MPKVTAFGTFACITIEVISLEEVCKEDGDDESCDVVGDWRSVPDQRLVTDSPTPPLSRGVARYMCDPEDALIDLIDEELERRRAERGNSTLVC